MVSTHASHKLMAVETEDGSFTLHSERFGATYHATQGAMEESRHVFITNGLQLFLSQFPKEELHILELGFGTGLNTFLTLLEAEKRELSIHYHAVECYPVPLEMLQQLQVSRHFSAEDQKLFLSMHEQAWDSEQRLSEHLCLVKYLEKIETFASSQHVDLIYFDAFSPKEQPELWTEAVFANMHALLHANGMLVTYCAQGQMKRNMKAAGFRVKTLKGFAAKREMTVAYRDLSVNDSAIRQKMFA